MRRTYGNLAFDKDRNRWLATAVEPHVVIKLKQIFPKIPSHQPDDFAFGNTTFNCTELLWFTDRYPLSISPRDLGLLKSGRRHYEAKLAEQERILTPDWTPPATMGLREGMQVRQYQAQAAEICHANNGLLLGDDVGLGKTYSAMALMLKPGTLPAAVVVEPHLQKQWQEKIEAFCGLRVHCVTTTKPYTLPPADVYIYRYSNIAKWTTVFKASPFKTVVYDEVQQLRTGTGTEKGAAASILSRYATYRLLMSATPIFNMGAEIYEILHFYDPAEHPLGNRDDFRREWVLSGTERIRNPEALGSHLRERKILLRRSKGDVGQEMDRVNTLVEEIPYDQKVEKEFEELARTLAIKTLSAPVFTERGQAARELDLLMRQTTGVAKAKNVAAYVRILVESGRKVLLVGWHRAVYETWLSEMKDLKPVMYTGTESPARKNASVSAFVSGETDLMIISLRSGSGLDGLQQVCSTVVFGELDWSPLVHHQVVGRLDREGQSEDTVDAIFLHSDAGSDPPMIELLGVKSSQAKGIMDPDKGVTTTRSEAGRIQHMAREYLRRRGIVVEEKVEASDALAIDPELAEIERQVLADMAAQSQSAPRQAQPTPKAPVERVAQGNLFELA